MAKHVAVTEWKFENNVFLPLSKSVTCTNGFNVDKLNDKLKPFAFLEEVLVGGDYSSFLADKIKENADKLPSYLGEFIGIMPPPLFRNIDEIGLIYPNGKNIYRVDYCSFELENGKICNVKKLDK